MAVILEFACSWIRSPLIGEPRRRCRGSDKATHLVRTVSTEQAGGLWCPSPGALVGLPRTNHANDDRRRLRITPTPVVPGGGANVGNRLGGPMGSGRRPCW